MRDTFELCVRLHANCQHSTNKAHYADIVSFIDVSGKPVKLKTKTTASMRRETDGMRNRARWSDRDHIQYCAHWLNANAPAPNVRARRRRRRARRWCREILTATRAICVNMCARTLCVCVCAVVACANAMRACRWTQTAWRGECVCLCTLRCVCV